ncbi:hypothetical protein BaRGS_00029074, partial [Batillaria attramentaria]
VPGQQQQYKLIVGCLSCIKPLASKATTRISLGNSTERKTAKSPNAGSTTPATAPASPTTATTPDGGDQVTKPRVRRSRSFGDAYLFSRRQSLQTSGFASPEWSAPSVIDEDGGEELDSEAGIPTSAEDKNESDALTSQPRHMQSKRDSYPGEKTPKGDYFARRSSAVIPLPDSRSNSPREKVHSQKAGHGVEKADRAAEFHIGSPRDDGKNAVSFPFELNQAKSGGRDRNSSGDKSKRKSVCVVAPSEMKLRRSNSERFSPEPNGQLKTSLTTRRSTITTTSRFVP